MPPTLAGQDLSNKNRYMLIINYNNYNNTLELLNVSSIKGKEAKLIYESNFEIKNYYPLRKPSFVKLDTLYVIDYFNDLNNYICFNGCALNNNELIKIINKRLKYINDNSDKINIINFSELDFRKFNI